MGTAVAVGASVVGGVVGLNNRKKQAKAERQMLDAQEAGQRMQADLQLFSLQQQRTVDNLNDIATDAANTQAYMSTMAQLNSQQLLNKLSTEQALFASDVERTNAEATRLQSDLATKGKQSDARLQAGAQALESFTSASAEEQQLVSTVLEQMRAGNNQSNSIAALLDLAASSGGVNEALALLSGGDQYSAERAANAVGRGSQLTGERRRLSDAAAKAGVNLADVEATMSNANAAIAQRSANYSANLGTLDATTAFTVNEQAFGAARAANEAQFGIMNSSSAVQRQSRYLNSLANEYSLQQGQTINQATLDAQRSSIRSPGFFDYAAVGLQGYGTYQQMRGLKS